MSYNRFNLGLLIKMRREELGIKQSQMAMKCGISRSAMSSIEKGRTSPPLEKMIFITRFLKMNFIENDIILRDEDGVTRHDYIAVKNYKRRDSISDVVEIIQTSKDLKHSKVSIEGGRLTISIDVNEIISTNGR